jgi:hypothetical protein
MAVIGHQRFAAAIVAAAARAEHGYRRWRERVAGIEAGDVDDCGEYEEKERQHARRAPRARRLPK